MARDNQFNADRQLRELEIRNTCLAEIQALRRETNLASEKFPVEDERNQFEQALRTNDTVLFQASTGAGKSLDLPIYVAHALPDCGRIAVTQPRRDAAQGVCLAAAARHNLRFGEDICFSTSEFKGNTDRTTIQVQTTALLLNRFKHDPLLRYYDAVVVDEAHERDLDIDSVLALIRRANTLRAQQGVDPIKLVVASATIDQEKFQKYLGCDDAATFDVEGRLHDVKQNYASSREAFYPLGPDQKPSPEPRPYTEIAVAQVMDILGTSRDGDILVFMPGKNTIQAVINDLQAQTRGRGVEILRLHGLDTMSHRSKVLKGNKRTGSRRVIVSTNMAETSVTVPNIKYVVDSNRKNEPTYDPETGLTTLAEVPSTKAESMQRKGRAGRLTKGEYFSVLTEEQYRELQDHPTPEMVRSKLSATILRLLNMGVKEIEQLEFIDQPPAELVKDALYELEALGVIDNSTDRNLTKFGEVVARLPLEPRLAVVVVTAQELGCLKESIEMTAMMNRATGVLRHRLDDDTYHWMRRITQSSADQQKALELNRQQQARYNPANFGESDPEQLDRMTKEFARLQSEEGLIRQLRTENTAASGDRMRAIGNDWLSLRQDTLRKTYDSDWTMYLSILQQYRRSTNRDQYCQQHGLDRFSLEKALDNIVSIERELKQAKVDTDVPSEHPELISQAILRAYAPDHLIMNTGSRHGVEFERVDRGDNTVRIGSSSAARDDIDSMTLAVALELKPGKGTKTVGRGRRVDTTWVYALGLHPVTQADLETVMPHRTRRNNEYASYSMQAGKVATRVELQFKTRTNNWKSIGQLEHADSSPGATRYLARQIIASDPVRNPDIWREEFQTDRNKVVAPILDQMSQRAQFVSHADDENRFDEVMNNPAVQWTGLEDWYTQQLGTAHSIDAALQRAGNFILTPDNFYSPEMRTTMEQQAPPQVTIMDVECPVSYKFKKGEKDHWDKGRHENQFSLTVSLSPLDLVAFVQLDQPELVALLNDKIGVLDIDEGSTDTIMFEYSFLDRSDDDVSLENLQSTIRSWYEQKQWRNWETPENQVIAEQQLTPWPDPLSTLPEAAPIAYGTGIDGTPLFTHPYVSSESVYNPSTRKYDEVYVVKHAQTEDEAANYGKSARTQIEEQAAKQQRSRDRAIMLEPARARVAALADAVKKLRTDYADMGISYTEAYEVGKKFDEAERLLQESDSYGSELDADPRKAMSLCNELQRILDEHQRISDERETHLPAATAQRDELASIADEVLQYGRYSRYGLTTDEFTALSEKWHEARQLINNRQGDIQRALELLAEVGSALQRDEITNWTSPAALAYKAVEGDRRYGIYAKITVRNGQVYNESGEKVSEFTIGASSRAMRAARGRDGRVRLQAIYSSGSAMSGVMILPDGAYAFSRDANEIFRVDLDDAGQVTSVHEQINPEYTDEPDIGMQAAPAVSESEQLSAMAAALGGLNVDSLKKRTTSQAPTTTKTVAPAIDSETRKSQAEQYRQSRVEEAARQEDLRRTKADAETVAAEASAAEARAAAEANVMTAEARDEFVTQLRPLTERLEAMRSMLADSALLTPHATAIEKLEARINRASSIKKLTRDVQDVMKDVTTALDQIAADQGWPINWLERRNTMLAEVIPGLEADPDIEIIYDPETDYADMMEAVVLDPTVTDDMMPQTFLEYYS